MAAGTVTGRNAKFYLVSHNAATSPIWNTSNSHDTYGAGDFTLTFGADIVDQDLVGVAGPYRARGTITCDGSLTISKFGGNLDIILENLVDTGVTVASSKYLAISGTVSTTDPGSTPYLNFYLASCQITGYDVTLGDAGTITNASIDFIDMIPQALTYANGTVKG